MIPAPPFAARFTWAAKSALPREDAATYAILSIEWTTIGRPSSQLTTRIYFSVSEIAPGQTARDYAERKMQVAFEDLTELHALYEADTEKKRSYCFPRRK